MGQRVQLGLRACGVGLRGIDGLVGKCKLLLRLLPLGLMGVELPLAALHLLPQGTRGLHRLQLVQVVQAGRGGVLQGTRLSHRSVGLVLLCQQPRVLSPPTRLRLLF